MQMRTHLRNRWGGHFVTAAGCEAEGTGNGQGQNSNGLLHRGFSFLYAPLCNGAVRSVAVVYTSVSGIRPHANTET